MTSHCPGIWFGRYTLYILGNSVLTICQKAPGIELRTSWLLLSTSRPYQLLTVTYFSFYCFFLFLSLSGLFSLYIVISHLTYYVKTSHCDVYELRWQWCGFFEVFSTCEHRCRHSLRNKDGARKYSRASDKVLVRGGGLNCSKLQNIIRRSLQRPPVQCHVLRKIQIDQV